MNYELIDFGNQCLPSILIRNILNKKKKYLFMLGNYSFNNICNFLENGILEDIYNKEYLFYGDKKVENFTDENKKYCHNIVIKNIKYNFAFNHDFAYDISNNTITNYDFIVNEFNEKIINFKELMINEKTPVFINFSENNKYFFNFEKMNNMLKKWCNKKFYIFVFLFSTKNTVNKIVNDYDNDNIILIHLENDLSNWHIQPKDIKKILFKEIYEKYCDTMKKLELENEFSDFDNLNINI